MRSVPSERFSRAVQHFAVSSQVPPTNSVSVQQLISMASA